MRKKHELTQAFMVLFRRMKGVPKKHPILLPLLALCLISLRALAEETPAIITWNPSDTNIPISINAALDGEAPEQLPDYEARLQTWRAEDIEEFMRFNLRKAEGTPQRIELEGGIAVLFNKETYESMVFLSDPNASWRYMNGRAEVCYNNALNGQYVSVTYTGNEIRNESLFDSEIGAMIKQTADSLRAFDIQMGAPLQMTVYYPYQEEGGSYEDAQPDFIEIAFQRLLNGVRIMPWGHETIYNGFTPKSFLTLYVDAEGVSNILLPLVFESLTSLGEKEVMGVDQAIDALDKHLSSLIFPADSKEIVVDYLSLEYVPLPITNEWKEFHLLPVWSFYTHYDSDEERQVVCLNAYTGDLVF